MLSGRLLVRTDLPWLNSMFALQKGIIQVMRGATRLAYRALRISTPLVVPAVYAVILPPLQCSLTSSTSGHDLFPVYTLCICLLDVII